jgi:hypothetical protein
MRAADLIDSNGGKNQPDDVIDTGSETLMLR